MTKIKKNIIITIVLTILLLTIFAVFLTLKNILNQTSDAYTNNNNIYKITYQDDNIYNTLYDITVYSDRVKVFEKNDCSSVICDEETKENIDKYSSENMDKLKNFLNNNFSFDEKNSIELKKESLSEYQERVINGLTMSQYFFELAIEEYKYKIEYYQNDSTSYDIYLKDNNSIIVKKCYINDYDITKIDTYSLNFSKNSIDKIYEYAEQEKEKDDRYENIIYKYATLRKDEKNIFNSIVYNDEKYIINDTEPQLNYTITYSGINCGTPILRLYDDNTYEYYYTYTSSDKALTPKTGTYKDNIKEIINDDKHDKYSYYSIKDEKNNKEYSISENNTKLHSFLNSIDVKLDMCLKQE